MNGRILERVLGSLALSLLLFAAPAFSEEVGEIAPAEDCEPGDLIQETPEADATSTLISQVTTPEPVAPAAHRPPRRGAPRARVPGAMRGALALPTPHALAPNHVALTAASQPSLFWHIDGVPDQHSKLVFTLIAADGIAPLLELELERPERLGIHRTRLADHGVILEPEIDYEWSVSLVVDTSARSRDIISSGSIRRVAGLSARSACQGAYWYDSLEDLIDVLDSAQPNEELANRRIALFAQAGLDPTLIYGTR